MSITVDRTVEEVINNKNYKFIKETNSSLWWIEKEGKLGDERFTTLSKARDAAQVDARDKPKVVKKDKEAKAA